MGSSKKRHISSLDFRKRIVKKEVGVHFFFLRTRSYSAIHSRYVSNPDVYKEPKNFSRALIVLKVFIEEGLERRESTEGERKVKIKIHVELKALQLPIEQQFLLNYNSRNNTKNKRKRHMDSGRSDVCMHVCVCGLLLCPCLQIREVIAALGGSVDSWRFVTGRWQ